MSKLLKWNDALYLVRYAVGKLQIQRVDVHMEKKTISLQCCNVHDIQEATALPLDACLIAATEVEDLRMATRYPVLAFLTIQETRQSGDATSDTKQETQSIETHELADINKQKIQSASNWLLFFYLLYPTEEIDTFQWGFLHLLALPMKCGNENAAVDRNIVKMFQVFLMDGPYVVFCVPSSQEVMLLNLHRAIHGTNVMECLKVLDMDHIRTNGSSPETFEMVSCTYVSQLHSTRPHLLIHTRRLPSLPSSDHPMMVYERHTWSIVDLDDERSDCSSKKEALLCPYLPVLSLATEYNGTMSKLEQTTCCCFIVETSQRDIVPRPFCDTDAFVCWNPVSRIRSTQTSIGVSTLVVTGTTSNTIYVHANGVLLVSYVLPAQPAEIWPLCEDNFDHFHVLCVRCDDENRSFFMLRFSSSVEHMPVELLLSFKHVGHAHNGSFAGTYTSDRRLQVLLLNDIRGEVSKNDCMYTIKKEAEVNQLLEHKQLLKRSVIVCQKSFSPTIKLSCHRLRLHEETKTKHGSRVRKRTCNKKNIGPDGSNVESFHYIERTQKFSSRDKSVNHIEPAEDGTAENVGASCAQLGKLAYSLSARLSNELQRVERLRLLVSDKVSLVHQLNQLIVRLWQNVQARASCSGNKHLMLLPLSAREVDSHEIDSQGQVNMETIVKATLVSEIGTNDGPMEPGRKFVTHELKLEQQVVLAQLTVLDYVPSLSLVHAEVVVRNLSDLELGNSYVSVTGPRGKQTSTQGWKCLSSIASELCPAQAMTEHLTSQQKEIHFQLHFQLAPSHFCLRKQRPLELVLWLHVEPSEDDIMSNTAMVWRPSELGFAIASVKFYPDDVLGIERGLRTTVESIWSGDHQSILKEQVELLCISSGFNLVTWFREKSSEIPTTTDSIIRRTLALIRINVRACESMLYELSKIVADLPLDVYVMPSPFQHTRLRALQHVLCSMRREILTIQHQNLQDKEKKDEKYGAGHEEKDQTHNAKGGGDPASSYRAMQCDTDLYVNRLLQQLQKRVDFHVMWSDAATNNVSLITGMDTRNK